MNEIKDLLPHRTPFLFVDAIHSCDKDRIVGERKYELGKDSFFEGHFPEYPVVPGVILIESMAQCGGAGLKKSGVADPGALFFLASVDKTKFRKQVRPGDTVRFEIENLMVSGRMIKQKGIAFVGDDIAAQATWMCLAGTKDDLK